MHPIAYKDFTMETFNVRELLKKKIEKCCLVILIETKTKGLDICIGDELHKLIALETGCKYYRNAFVINIK